MDRSYWQATSPGGRFPKLTRNLKVDTVVIGGGITGITTAYLLKRSGLTVALLERDRIGGIDSTHTTAHLTSVIDKRLPDLVKQFGRDHAQAVWDAGAAAIDTISQNIDEQNILCEFKRIPGYLHASLNTDGKNERKSFQKEAKLAEELGFHTAYLESIPFFNRPGMRVPNQAKFHPLKYLSGLAKAIPGKGCHVFEHSNVAEISDKPLTIKCNRRTITCKYLVIATHVPLMGIAGLMSAALFQSKLASYSSYAIGAKAPKGSLPEATFWDTSDPYHYLRVDAHHSHDYIIFGGEDHKTGQITDTKIPFTKLESMLQSFLPSAKITSRWSGQVVETNDGLPFIGEISPGQFIATGFSGNGMTFGTLSAMMACDAATGRKNPWSTLFEVHRKKILGGTWDYLKENIDYPYYMIKDRLMGSDGNSLRSLKPDQGKILSLHGQRVAAYRNTEGKVTKLSPVCTHLGCLVHWNPAEKTWDCPCHGSRFKCTGELLTGPAETSLAKIPDKKTSTS